MSLGKSNYYLWLNAAQILIVITAVLICYQFGITVMVVAFAIINILWLLAWQTLANRLIGYSFINMLRDLVPFMLITMAVLSITYIVTLPITNIYVLLTARVVIAGLLYMVVMKYSRAKIYKECVEFLRSRIQK